MRSTSRAIILALLICGFADGVFSAQIATQLDGDTGRLVWQGDERIEISFSRSRGLLEAPINVRVDDRSFSFDGFYVAFNGEHDGYVSKSVSMESEADSLRVTHLLEHPRLPSPIRVVVRVSLSPKDKAVRFEIETDNGERLHLDRLGVGHHHGEGIGPNRMFVTKLLVLEPPIEPFKLKYNYNCLRYWCFTMANGITAMMARIRCRADSTSTVQTGLTICTLIVTRTLLTLSSSPARGLRKQWRSTVRRSTCLRRLRSRNYRVASRS